MGNSSSSTLQTPRTPRPSTSGSPHSRHTSASDDLYSPPSSLRSRKPVTETRRRRSIELGDVDPSLAFTSPSGAGGRRKYDKHVADLSPDDDLEPVGGTLRGAMQGKAEHVVYGPRRPDGLPAPLAASPAHPHVRPTTIAIPSVGIPAVADPDDTLHPSYKGSARLTSDVLFSSDQMPVIVSPGSEGPPGTSSVGGNADVASGSGVPDTGGLLASAYIRGGDQFAHDLPIPHTASPYAPTSAPVNTITAPPLPTHSFPLAPDAIPSGTSVLASPSQNTPEGTPKLPSPAVLLPPNLFNVPVAAIPIPLLSVPSATIAASLMAAAVDLGAGKDGVPTLIKWKNEDGQSKTPKGTTGPREVFVTGTFANGWKTKIELRKTDPSDFSALISLPPGPHRLKFIVDREWKASKHLPVATDADGNLINYLQVNLTDHRATAALWSLPGVHGPVKAGGDPVTSLPAYLGLEDDENLDHRAEEEGEWTQEIPNELVEWGEWEAERDAAEGSSGFSNVQGQNGAQNVALPPPPPFSGVPPPSLPAQLEKGPLNHAAYVTQGSGDDNSILPKPDHSVINHLAASPIKGGFLSVGVTTRYKRKFVTIVYYKALAR